MTFKIQILEHEIGVSSVLSGSILAARARRAAAALLRKTRQSSGRIVPLLSSQLACATVTSIT